MVWLRFDVDILCYAMNFGHAYMILQLHFMIVLYSTVLFGIRASMALLSSVTVCVYA